jgi:hypothetical protein
MKACNVHRDGAYQTTKDIRNQRPYILFEYLFLGTTLTITRFESILLFSDYRASTKPNTHVNLDNFVPSLTAITPSDSEIETVSS